MYFNYGIFAFGWEVGGSVYNPATGNFQAGSFQPPWVGTPDLVSGHSETMEYSNGIIEMFRIAADFGRDKTPATSSITPGARQYDSPTAVKFDTNEPATVYYTTDGSAPTMQLAALQADRVPRAGRGAVAGQDHDVQVVLGRRRGQRRAGGL